MMIYTYPTLILPGERFADRESYLSHCLSEDNHRKEYRENTTWICHAVSRSNKTILEKGSNESVVSKSEFKNLKPYFPWITLVLGSGCVTETVDWEALKPAHPDAIVNVLSKHETTSDELSLAEVREFSRNLIFDRSHGKLDDGLKGHFSKTCELHTAQLVYVAAKLTRIYRDAASGVSQPLAWRVEDVVALDKNSKQNAGELLSEYQKFIEPVIEVLISDRSRIEKSEKNILLRIKNSLTSRREINRLDIQILSEFAWLSLTEKSSHYHGWSDLLSFLARQEGSLDGSGMWDAKSPIGYPPRPSVAVSDIIKKIKLQYLKKTRESWGARVNASKQKSSSRSPLHLFFDSAAEMLIAQQRLHSDPNISQKAVGAPVVTAFSTSFDLELEMALSSLLSEGDTFTVVVPVCFSISNKVNTGNKISQEEMSEKEGFIEKLTIIQWLGAEINGKTGFEGKNGPDIKSWKLISSKTINSPEGVSTGPFVVHLAGTPLIAPPSVGEAQKMFEKMKGSFPNIGEAELVGISPAILLNEYDAIQHHGAEVFLAGQNDAWESSSGIPREFSSSGASGVPRFWLVMGVQMNDPAFRYKIAARLTSPQSGSPAVPKPKRTGLVVTSNLDPAARELLAWNGMDIVTASCTEFEEDFRHYVSHLQEGNLHVEPESYFDYCGL